MVVGSKVCELTDDIMWFVCGLYVGILTSPLNHPLSTLLRIDSAALRTNCNIPVYP